MSKLKSLMKAVVLPGYELVYWRWRTWRRPLAPLLYRGGQHYCPICASNVRVFLGRHKERLCPVCGAAERSRVDWTFLHMKIAAYGGARIRVLHVAPEVYLAAVFRKMSNLDYVSIDLASKLAMVKMDITDLRFPNSSFDLIYCSHVLEHVVEDRKAMAEFFRVLKPGGLALLQVPMSGANTHEDWSITSPEARRKAFGDPGHVRRYGMDYMDRLRDAGFSTTVLTAQEMLSRSECDRCGVAGTRRLFSCTKDRH